MPQHIHYRHASPATKIPRGIKVLACLAAIQPLQQAQAEPIQNDPLDAGIAWQLCAQGFQKGDIGFIPAGADANADIYISADSATASGAGHGQVELSGKVEITQEKDILKAGKVSLDRATGQASASGNVFLRRAELRLSAQQVDYNLNSKTGKASASEYRLSNIPARGSAQQSELLENNRSRFQNMTYTTCQPGNAAWQLEAGTLAIDPNEGLGTARNATLSLGGVPIVYLPVMAFPIGDRRRSGLLAPSIGYSENNGFDASVPYYFNLAPNYDLTLKPRVMTERGTMLGAEFRFLTGQTNGILEADYLPNDNSSEKDSPRGSLSLKASSRFSPNLRGSIGLQHVSDDNYLDDLGGDLALSSTSLLRRFAEMRYDDLVWNISGRIQSYQGLNTSKPYDLLPQVVANAEFPSDSPLVYQLESELGQFSKNNTVVEGTRLNIQPAISYGVEEDFYHLTPKASIQYTAFNLDNPAGTKSSPDRLLPIFSMDGGLYYERDTSLLGTATIQTLEPRIFYLYVPKDPQDDLPQFDVSEYSFNSIGSLFAENRFNSPDRLGDANQLALALTTRYYDAQTGRESLNASIGQVLYFRDREVTLSGTPETDSTSPIISEVNAEFGRGWRGRGGVAWDPHDSVIDDALVQVSYADGNDRILNLAYRLNDDVSTHTNVSAIWPLTDRAKMIGHWNYSISESNTLEGVGGVEYGSCCWRVRALARYHNNTDDGSGDLGLFLQFELKGLGKFGDNIEGLLARGIYGYRREDD